jgi:hypothetical protein
MDVAHPIRTVVPSLEGPILQVLAGAIRPLTGREIQRSAGIGSPSGVRQALERLVAQGLVRAVAQAPAIFYTANREHLAWPAVEALAGLRRATLASVQHELESWQVRPVHASAFGSLARGEGGAESDIELLLVRPDDLDATEPAWGSQVERLCRGVLAWTGNRCLPVGVGRAQLAGDPRVESWLRDSITLIGLPLRALLRTLPG